MDIPSKETLDREAIVTAMIYEHKHLVQAVDSIAELALMMAKERAQDKLLHPIELPPGYKVDFTRVVPVTREPMHAGTADPCTAKEPFTVDGQYEHGRTWSAKKRETEQKLSQ